MSYIRERIEKTIRAIAKAEADGKDTSEWQKYVIGLVNRLQNPRVRVKVGKFGFCTCSKGKGNGLCCGCWKIKHRCECIEREVDPNIEITRQFQNRANGVH